MSIKLDEINVMNINDMDYYESCYQITILISNAINPVFEVYSNSADMALEILIEKLIELDSVHITIVEINDCEEVKENYYNVNGYWINLDYINIVEVY